jgi:GTPase SAR1 family protein
MVHLFDPRTFQYLLFRQPSLLQAVVLVYDVMRPETFDSLSRWLEQAENYTPEHAVIMVLGNKRDSQDIQPSVLTARAQDFATKIGADFMEVSAKTGLNVNEAFQQIAKEVMDEVKRKTLHEALITTPLAVRSRSQCF